MAGALLLADAVLLALAHAVLRRELLLAELLLLLPGLLLDQLLLDQLLSDLLGELEHPGVGELLDGLLRDLLQLGVLGEYLHERVGLRLLLDECELLQLLGEAGLLRQHVHDLLTDQLQCDAVRQQLLGVLHLLGAEPGATLLWAVRAAAVPPAAEHLALADRGHGRCVRHR
ncbi:hypothetical protein KRMM14A1004_58240 [Krasilnikovia sp. MM14-A1004]